MKKYKYSTEEKTVFILLLIIACVILTPFVSSRIADMYYTYTYPYEYTIDYFDYETNEKLRSLLKLSDYEYIELTEIRYQTGKDRNYEIFFKVPKSKSEKFNKEYLSDYIMESETYYR